MAKDSIPIPILMRHIDHYLPVWLPLLLGIIPAILYLFTFFAISQSTSTGQPSGYAWKLCGGMTPSISRAIIPDLLFAVFAFWIWALTTNAHSKLSARTGGRNSGTVDVRSKEIATIVACCVITGIAFLFATLDITNKLVQILLLLPVGIPPLFLAAPSNK